MIDTPEILAIPAQPTARIHLTVPSSEIMSHMMPALREVRQALNDQGVTAAGPWLTHHFKIPDQTFDFEICIPVKSAIAPQGRVLPDELRATRIIRTVYHGDYSGLPQGWG